MSKSKDIGDLVADPDVRREFGVISEDTLARWDADAELGFPPKITIRNRNYRSRVALDEFKARLVAEALQTRPRPPRPRKK